MNPTQFSKGELSTFFNLNPASEYPSEIKFSQNSSPLAPKSPRAPKRKIEFLSEAQSQIRANMVRKTIRQVPKSDINAFIANLIAKMEPERYFVEIYELQKIQQKLHKPTEFPLELVKLATVHENNPIIQILLSLKPEEICALGSIPVPACFPDFFEELDFYATVEETQRLYDPMEKINSLLCHTDDFIYIKQKNKAIKLLDLAKTITDSNPFSLQAKTNNYHKIAEVFLQVGDKNKAIEMWLASAHFVNNFDILPLPQLGLLQEIAQHLVNAEAWNEVPQILNIILRNPHFWDAQASSIHPEEPIYILKKILQQVIERTDLPTAIRIIKDTEDHLNMDPVLEKLCDALKKDPISSTDLMTLARCIRSGTTKSRVFQNIYQKFLIDRDKAS